METLLRYAGWLAIGELAYLLAIPLARFTLFYVPRRTPKWMRREAWKLASWWPVTAPLLVLAALHQWWHRRRELQRSWDRALAGDFPPPRPECCYCAGAMGVLELDSRTADGRHVHPECADALRSVESS